MEKLTTLTDLLRLTLDAQKFIATKQSEQLKTIIGEMKYKARETKHRSSEDRHRGSDLPTRYELCMIGVLEELDFRKKLLPEMGLDARLHRIREEIERTMEEVKFNHG